MSEINQKYGKIGLLIGNGDIVDDLIKHLKSDNAEFFVIPFNGITDAKHVQNCPHKWLSIGKAGQIIQTLKQENVQTIIMIGAMQRPNVLHLAPDLEMLKILKSGIFQKGDDKLLSFLVGYFEQHGFAVIGIHEILDYRARINTVYHQGNYDLSLYDEDIEQGVKILNSLSQFDIGQGLVMQQGLTLAIETIEGTQKMLSRVPDVIRKSKPGAILIKGRKSQQIEQVDFPTIGPKTIIQAAQAGCDGIVVEENGVLIFNEREIITNAHKYNIFVKTVSFHDINKQVS